MYQKDYLLRIIEQFVAALQKLINNIRNNPNEESLEEVTQHYENLIEVEELKSSYPLNAELYHLLIEKRLNEKSIEQVCNLLLEEANLLRLISNKNLAYNQLQKAQFLLTKLENESITYSITRLQLLNKATEIQAKLETHDSN